VHSLGSSQPDDVGPFRSGIMVVASLGNPREKFWGTLLALTPSGLSICGLDLGSFEDSAGLLKSGEGFDPAAVFFPMHRIERLELDAPSGSIPSLRQRFLEKSGEDPAKFFWAVASSAASQGTR
jgi:hypothetical protein